MRATFLRTRVARRILLYFVLCALLPVGALSVVAYRHVRSELLGQARARLAQDTKVHGMAVLERLQGLEVELQVYERALAASSGDTAAVPVALSSRFVTLMRIAESGEREILAGQPRATPAPLDSITRAAVTGGKTTLGIGEGPTGPAVYLVKPSGGPTSGATLWAELEPRYLWGADYAAPGEPAPCVFDPRATRALDCRADGTAALREHVAGVFAAGDTRGELEWESESGERMLAGYWSVFLRFAYGSPSWVVVVSEPTDAVLAPLGRFRTTFWLVVALALVVVFFLSNVQIRRSTEPIEHLQAGTRRIARGDFTSTVTVRTDDEFGELADSFNSMARELASQFAALSAIDHIDRAVLAREDAEPLLEAVLGQLRSVEVCDYVVLARPVASGGDVWEIAVTTPAGERLDYSALVSEEERAALRERWEPLVVDSGGGSHRYLPSPTDETLRFAVLPLRRGPDLIGLVALGFRAGAFPDDLRLGEAQRLADRVALALSNVQLVDRLGALTLGTMTAFARAIETNSAWTAGHSERVTRLALAIADQLRLTAEQRDQLQRGGLLHDVGKIGIPPAILDKPGRLTDEEYAVIREHPSFGARILAPIAAFADVIPIVLHHHERYDGGGYPSRLAGEDIPLLARVLAVADVYDALVSDRPYRKGWAVSEAIAFIEREAGRQFDPDVAAAFVAFARGKRRDAVASMRAQPADSHVEKPHESLV